MKSYSKIDNNAILSLIGYSPKNFDGDPNPIIVTSYMSNGSLDKILNKCRKSLTPTKFTSTKKIKMVVGIILEMIIINLNIVYREFCKITFQKSLKTNYHFSILLHIEIFFSHIKTFFFSFQKDIH